jgi:DNA-binding NtrC family response regulator
VRIIAATNRALAPLVASGEFREDLFYRLNVVPVRVPPLRERAGDLPLLVRHFVAKFAGGKVTVTREALEALERYRWPGNVRELENFCERIVLMRSHDVIDGAVIVAELAALERETPAAIGATLHEIERTAIVDALRASGWNRSRAARRLGVARHILLYRIKKFDIRDEGESTSR